MAEGSFWETLERVAARAGGQTVPRPKLVEFPVGAAPSLALGSTDAPAAEAPPSAPARPAAQAGAILELLSEPQSVGLPEFGHDRAASDDDAGLPAQATTDIGTAESWDNVELRAVPGTFLAGLAAKHRIFEETGEIDVDLDRLGRRRRRRRHAR